MAKKQTLVQAVYLITSEQSAMARSCSLAGKPVGSDPATAQAVQNLEDALPARCARSYTVRHIIDALYDGRGDRWERRSAADAMAEAARIEASKA